MAVEFLPDELDGAELAVEIAWGADLAAPPDEWVWSDITEDVRYTGPINIRMGRDDEASESQPAEMTLQLDNTSGDYSIGPRSRHYPHVRRSTPVRVRVWLDDTNHTLFVGNATGFTPSWDLTGTVSTVSLRASGTLRRLEQRRKPIRSALTRSLSTIENAVAWWPLEEDEGATFGAPVVGIEPMVWNPRPYINDPNIVEGRVTWGAATDNPASLRAPEIEKDGIITARVHSAKLHDSWVVAWAQRVGVDSGGWARFHTTDDEFTVTLTFYGADNLIRGELVTGPLDSVTLFDHYLDGEAYDNVWHFYALTVRQIDTGVSFLLEIDGMPVASNVVSDTLGELNEIEFQSGEEAISVSHVLVMTRENYDDVKLQLAEAHAAHVGESPVDRIRRLCDEGGVPLTVVGKSTTVMGPQFPDAFLPLLRECEIADQGVLYDGVDVGLRYVARDQRENAEPALVVDAAAGQLAPDFTPVDDDQRNTNSVVASQREGASAEFRDVDGPLGVDAIGLYDEDIEVNIAEPGLLYDYASWMVHLGTVGGYRYPSFSLNLRESPELARDWLGVTPSSRVDLIHASTVFPDLADEPIHLLVEGIEMTLSPIEWTVTAQCSPFEPWRVAVLGVDSDYTPDSELAAPADVDDDELYVATLRVPEWIEEEFPLDFELAGERVTVHDVIPGALDLFDRTVSEGWGTSTLGNEWTVDNPAVFSVNDFQGLVVADSPSLIQAAYLEGFTTRYLDVLVEVSVDRMAENGWFVTWVLSTRDTGLYAARLEWRDDGRVLLALYRDSEPLTGEFVGDYAADQQWHIRFVADGDQLRAKAWQVGEFEPDDWQVEATDATHPSDGGVGVQVETTSEVTSLPVEFRIHEVSVGNPARFLVTRGVNGVRKAHDTGTPVQLWRIAGLDAARADTSGSELARTLEENDTTIEVVRAEGTTIHSEWSEKTDDLPYLVDIGGEHVQFDQSTVIHDDFEREVIEGWDTPTSSPTVWEISGDVDMFSVSEGIGWITVSDQEGGDWIASHETNIEDSDTSTEVSFNIEPDAYPTIIGLAARYVDENNYYISRMIVYIDQVDMDIVKIVDGIEQFIDGESDVDLDPGAGIRTTLRFRVDGNMLKFKAWQLDEPGDWQVDTTDDEIQGAGGIGVYVKKREEPVEIGFHWFDSSTPSGAQRFHVTRAVNGVRKEHSEGTPVKLAYPAVIAL